MGLRENLTTSAPVLELHVCMGHDESGRATLPGTGTGTCATALHVCHGDNECRVASAGPFKGARPDERGWADAVVSTVECLRLVRACFPVHRFAVAVRAGEAPPLRPPGRGRR